MTLDQKNPLRSQGEAEQSPLTCAVLSPSITNLKYWGRCEPITSKTLQLLNDLSIGYPLPKSCGCRTEGRAARCSAGTAALCVPQMAELLHLVAADKTASAGASALRYWAAEV